MATITEKEIRELTDKWGGLQLQIQLLEEDRDATAKEITDWLRSTGRLLTITGELAVAKRCEESKLGKRKISPADFFNAAADCDPEDVNACLTVGVTAAEELLGKKKVNQIADRPTSKKIVETLELKK